MSGRYLRKTAVLLVLAAGIVCGLSAVRVADMGGMEDNLYQLRYEHPQQASAILLDTLDQEWLHYALFKENIRTVDAPLLRREKRLVHIELAGDPALLFLPGRLQSGNFPSDARGCVVDLLTARELWGSDAPIGMELECGGRRYDVTGVVAASRALVLTKVALPLDFAAALFQPDTENIFPHQAIQQFEQALSEKRPLRGDVSNWRVWMQLLAKIPFWLLFMKIASYILRRSCFRSGIWLASMLPCAALAGWILRLPNPLLPDMLPTQWSDFSFWQRQVEAMVNNICTAWTLPGTLCELLFWCEVMLPVFGWATAACICFGLAWKMGTPHFGGERERPERVPLCLISSKQNK